MKKKKIELHIASTNDVMLWKFLHNRLCARFVYKMKSLTMRKIEIKNKFIIKLILRHLKQQQQHLLRMMTPITS